REARQRGPLVRRPHRPNRQTRPLRSSRLWPPRGPVAAAALTPAQVTHEASACGAALLAFALPRMIAATTTSGRRGDAHAPSYASPRGGGDGPIRALRRNRPTRPRAAGAPRHGEAPGRLRALRR